LSRSKPDGYSLGVIGTPSFIVSSLDEKRGASYTRDSFTPLGLQVVDPGIVGVSPDSPYKTAKDLIDAAKANPGKIRASTTGLQTGEHFAIADLQRKTGAQLRPVHFNDGASAATAAFLGGNFEVYLGNTGDATDLVKQKKLRLLGVLDSERSPALPDVPTFKEQGFDVEQVTARGWAAPAGLPAAVATKLESALGRAIQDPGVVAQMKKLGLDTRYMPAKPYNQYLTELETGIKALMPAVAESK
jgi:tripartite-type tricarboxylate transporter receptor subunit TctC